MTTPAQDPIAEAEGHLLHLMHVSCDYATHRIMGNLLAHARALQKRIDSGVKAEMGAMSAFLFGNSIQRNATIFPSGSLQPKDAVQVLIIITDKADDQRAQWIAARKERLNGEADIVQEKCPYCSFDVVEEYGELFVTVSLSACPNCHRSWCE